MYLRQVGVVSVFARGFNVLATSGGCTDFIVHGKYSGLFTVSKPRYITAVKPCRYNPRFFRTITVCH